MSDKHSYNYAVIRIVPHVEREEFINAGVILFCKTRRYLESRIHLDVDRLRTIAPAVDTDEIGEELEIIPRICAGGSQAGPIGGESQSERFHWLTSSRSTVIQTSPVHTGLCEDPEAELEELFDQLVLV